jgi:hypothetical protein
MTAYDTAAIAAALAGLTAPASNTLQIGDRMQDLAVYLLDEMPGVTVKKQKSKNFGESEEIDIWFEHQAHLSGLPFSDFSVPVECKNEKKSIGSEDISRLGTKISNSAGTDGLFIGRKKLSGHAADKNGHLAVHDELVQGRRIVVISGADIAKLTTTQDLVDLMVDRFTELRMYGGYHSI